MGNSLSSRTTGEDIMKGKSLVGCTAVITGANSGIGREMTRLLAAAGARVIMAVRKREAGEHAAGMLRRGFAACNLEAGTLVVMECNLASFASIRAFAAELERQEAAIDVLVLNAAVRGCPKWYTQESFEMHMGVNYIGHWHLTHLLLPRISAQPQPSRIVIITCLKELDTSIKLNDLNFGKVSYDPFRSYKASKAALTLFGMELARQLSETQVRVIAADPGVTGETGLFRFMGPLVIIFAFAKPFLKTLQQASATPLFACVAPVTTSSTRRRSSMGAGASIPNGALLSDCHVKAGNCLISSRHVAESLWNDTQKLVDEAVIGSHKDNAGYGGQGSLALLLMKWIIEPLFQVIRRAFRSAAATHAQQG